MAEPTSCDSLLVPDPEDPTGDPFAVVAQWIPPGTGPRGLMTLSTIERDGMPGARALLLSSYDTDGFCFHTDSRSAKTAALAVAPAAAMSFTWPETFRHLVVRGLVTHQSPADAAAAYRERDDRLKTLAWLNTAEFARLPMGARRERWAAFVAQPGALAEPPPNWVGYRLAATELTFWQGTVGAGSLRVRYSRRVPDPGEPWRHVVLPG